MWCCHRGKAECSPTAVANEDLPSPSLPQHHLQPPSPFCLMFPAQVQLLLASTIYFSYAQTVLPPHNYVSPILFQYSFDFPPFSLHSVRKPVALPLYTTFHHCLFCLYIKLAETYKKLSHKCVYCFERISSCLTVCRVHFPSVGIYLITLFSIKFCSVECNRQ